MERAEAIERLPQTYGVLLRGLDRGLDHGTLAALVAVEPDDIPSLLDVAHAKLARLLESESSPNGSAT